MTDHDHDHIDRVVYDIHLHIHDAETSKKLDTLLAQFSAFAVQEKQIMADVTSIKGLVSAIDTETNAVAAKVDAQSAAIQALKDQIANGTPVTQADLDEIQSALQPISDRLTAIGADPANPIPLAKK